MVDPFFIDEMVFIDEKVDVHHHFLAMASHFIG